MSSDRHWNYLTVEVKPGLMGLKTEHLQEELTKHGAQGWELVSVLGPVGMIPAILIFKRPQ